MENTMKCVHKTLCNRKILIALGLGQILSLLICGTAITSGLLGEYGVNIPTAQSFLNYVALCVVYTPILACKGGDDGIVKVLKLRGWKYIILALIDVEANYLIVKAYQYTTVTSVQLLDCFTIPTVLFCSWCFLRVRYKWPHFLGVAICLIGVATLIVADVLVDQHSSNAGNKILGDFLCLFGAMLYGLSNVGQEFVVRSFNRVEFLGMIGLFGSVINGVQFVVLERKELADIDLKDYKIVICLLVFAACLFVLYSLMPVVIEKTSATAINLNLLSADFYALLVGLFIFRYTFHVLYFISFVVIMVGLVVYSIRAAPAQLSNTDYTTVTVHIDSTQDTPLTDSSNSSPVQTEKNEETTNLCASTMETNYVEVRDMVDIKKVESQTKSLLC